MKLLWNAEGTHAVVRAQIREFVIVNNEMDSRTDLFIKTSNGGNVFFQSFANKEEAQAFIATGIMDVDKKGDDLPPVEDTVSDEPSN